LNSIFKRAGIAIFATVWAIAAAAHSTSPAADDEVEPRVIGQQGTMMVGFAGYVDRLYSSERIAPTNLTIQVDAGRFITRRIVVRGGLAGSGTFGGADANKLESGTGVPALHVFAGPSFYFTPQALWSLYAGGEYWMQLTQPASPDRGAAIGILGLEGAMSSRVNLFAQGGYGIGFTGTSERTNRMIGRVGLRVKF
jgi:hypothetical protein